MSKAQELADGQSEAQMIAGWLESGGGHGVPSMHALRAARELRRLERVNAELVKTGRELKRFYAHIWDRVDGAIVLMPQSVDAFEDAFESFCAALSSSGGNES